VVFENIIRLYDVNSGSEVKRFSGATNAARRIAFSLDGKMLAFAGND
jgi:WD40 repeat protein